MPVKQLWATRLCAAYARIFEGWIAGVEEIEAVLGDDGAIQRLITNLHQPAVFYVGRS